MKMRVGEIETNMNPSEEDLKLPNRVRNLSQEQLVKLIAEEMEKQKRDRQVRDPLWRKNR